MARVTGLHAQGKNRVQVYLDGELAFTLRPAVAMVLSLGEEVDGERMVALQQQDARESAHERALHYLFYRARSHAEVHRYLQGKGYDEHSVDHVLERLERAGLLNDLEFARFWVENRETFRPKGIFALRYELRQKGIAEDIIQQVLEDVSPRESAYRAASQRATRMTHLEPEVLCTRLSGFLLRRGFGYGVVRETIDRVRRDLAEGSDKTNGEWNDTWTPS